MKWTRWILVAGLCTTAEAKPNKKKKGDEGPPPPTTGWIQAEGAMGACYVPPDFEAMGLGDRRAARNDAMVAIKSQWSGERNDGVAFEPGLVEGVETVLLGYPEKTEDVAKRNLDLCRAAMTGGGTAGWQAWLEKLPKQLTDGECVRPLDTTMYWYLDIATGWQGGMGICQGNTVRVWSSANDYYRIDDGGPWINSEGDRNKPATGEGYLCTTEGCYAGQLILRFRGDSGVEVIKPVGLELKFTAPEHGTIEFTINETNYPNNIYKVERGLQHHTAVTYEPVQ